MCILRFLDQCNQEEIQTQIQFKVKVLVTKCDADVLEKYYLPLFTIWGLNLLSIENIFSSNGKVIYKRRDKMENCFDVCGNANKQNVTSSINYCICATLSTSSVSTTDVNLSTSLSNTSMNRQSPAPKSAPVLKNEILVVLTTPSSDVISTYPSNETNNTVLSSPFYYNNSMSMNNTNVTKPKEEKYRFFFIMAIGTLSSAILLVNFLLILRTCIKNQPSVIDSFGVSLMLFNLLLAVYGGALALYLYNIEAEIWSQKFCQGFTSIKLFGMGATVWTFMLLTYHHAIKESTPEETDAIYKSIVLILEGLMLSGVFAVMSWIKLDKWDYLCVIFEPSTPVEWLLTGIELLYYFMALVLVIRYPIHEFLKRNKKKSDKKKSGLDGNFPIFLMILFCLSCWISGYVVTQKWAEMFTWSKLNAVIRVCSVIFPHLICPLIYSIRNTCCCICPNMPCLKKEKLSNSIEHSILHCECDDDDDTCSVCLNDPMISYENSLFSEQQHPASEKNGKPNRRKNAVYNNNSEGIQGGGGDFVSPKAIVRSPVMTSKQKSKTLKNEKENAEQMIPLLEIEDRSCTQNTKPNTLVLSTEFIPLLDDTDGNSKKPPKASSESTPVKVLVKQDSTLNSPSDYPSFISIDAALDADKIPKMNYPQSKKNKSKLQSNGNGFEEGRKSRGPTFYPLEEQADKAQTNSKIKPTLQLNNDISKLEDSNELPEQNKLSKRRKKNKKKKKSSDANTPTHNSQRNSTTSLEWDHSYSYSDSSGSSSSVTSANIPDNELKAYPLISTTTKTTTTEKAFMSKTSETTINDTKSKQNNNAIPNDINKHLDHAMEWDPSACEIKRSPIKQAKEVDVQQIPMINNKTKSPETRQTKTQTTNGKVS